VSTERSAAAVARGPRDVSEGDFNAARAQLRIARELPDPGFAGRLLEERLANT